MAGFSRELCGGIHTGRTGNIGMIKIVSESSVAAGVRRIEALTGSAALAFTQNRDKIVSDISGIVREKPEAVTSRVKKLIADQKALEKEIDQLKTTIASKSVATAADEIRHINGIKVLAKKVEIDKPAALRDLADRFKDKIESGIVVLGAVIETKVLLIVIVTKDLTDRYHAGKIIKQVAAVVGGGGGGRPDMAQAGGTKPENLDKAFDKAYEVVTSA